MDEKKVREAINHFKGEAKAINNTWDSFLDDAKPFMAKNLELRETAIEALEKQLPKKPKIHKEFKGEIDFDCPECGRAFVMEKADAMQCCPYCECRFNWSEQS